MLSLSSHIGQKHRMSWMSHCELYTLKYTQIIIYLDNRNEAFVVLSRTAGWWMVQRNNPISGTVSRNQSKQGWVPSGALLETSIPVTTAIAEAKTARISISIRSLTSSMKSSKPILPSCILSASFQSVVLKDYQAKGDGETGLLTNDLVRVYKKYNHWAYVGNISRSATHKTCSHCHS